MSYILEALADSEQARLQIAAAPRYSLLPAVGEELPRARVWPYVLAGALLVNAAVLLLWLRPAAPGGAQSIKVPVVPQTAEIPMAVPEPVKAPVAAGAKPTADGAAQTLPQAQQPLTGLERGKDPRSAGPSRPADAHPRMAPANPANAAAPMPIAKVAPKAKAKPAAAAVAATAATPALPAQAAAGGTAESPPALPQDLPALSVAGFIRDEGASGMVIVNDRLVREGEEVAPGVKLEKIVGDGLVFNYKGYRFKR